MRRLNDRVSLVIILLIGLGVLLPLVVRYPVEYDPWHTHIVLRANSPREAAEALADHFRRNGQRETQQLPSAQAEDQPDLQVISLADPSNGQVVTLLLEVQGFITPDSTPGVVLPFLLIHVSNSPALIRNCIVLFPPKPPPRIFS